MALIVIDVLTSPERDAAEERLHVGERADRHADPADLSLRPRRVGVVAHLRRQVEGDRQPRLALLEEVLEPPVRLGGGREAGVLAHRPEPAAVHRRLDAAGEGELPRPAEVASPRRGRPCRPACRGRGSRCRSSSRTARAAPPPDFSAFARVVARQRSRPIRRRSGGDRHRAPGAAPRARPSGPRRPRSARPCPARGARSSFCIFIASTTRSCWPASTVSPSATETARPARG